MYIIAPTLILVTDIDPSDPNQSVNDTEAHP